mmetsp:Transcript_32971/g.69392  ORF Transcript_32971/g.69392 Transcript_32971/m.69392 type:complete len:91 (+) Transcript_32971:146-418(+)
MNRGGDKKRGKRKPAPTSDDANNDDHQHDHDGKTPSSSTMATETKKRKLAMTIGVLGAKELGVIFSYLDWPSELHPFFLQRMDRRIYSST